MTYSQWDRHFETGIPDFDTQHRNLLDLINTLNTLVADDAADPDRLTSVFDALSNHAAHHFENEEALMSRLDIDSRHVLRHQAEHEYFLRELARLNTMMDTENCGFSSGTLEFLKHWPVYHILGIDQCMAAQIHAVEDGTSPEAAFDDSEQRRHNDTTPFLNALTRLYKQATAQNRQLVKRNQSLDIKAAECARDLAETNRRLQELTLTDSHTGLPNRRSAMQYLKQLWRESVDTDSPLSCLLLDTDGLRQINETHGHDAGDQVLLCLARTLANAMRNDDVVCRLGGGEFFVICPNTPKSGALHLASQTHGTIRTLKVPLGTGPVSWTGEISIGVTTRHPDMVSMESMIKAADKGVSMAKASGKNCICFSDNVILDPPVMGSE